MPRYTNPPKTWQYSMEFNLRAVKMTFSSVIQIKQVTEGLGPMCQPDSRHSPSELTYI